VRVLVATSIFGLALAGCAASQPAAEETTPPVSTSVPTTTPTPTLVPLNHPPTANLTAGVTGGPVPLAVSFTINGTDFDGDELQYNLTFGDETPAESGSLNEDLQIIHTFTIVGSFTVVLNVSDGTSFTLNSTTIEVGLPPEPVIFSGEVLLPDAWASTIAENNCFLAILTGDDPLTYDLIGRTHRFPHPLDGWSYAFDNADMGAIFWDDAPNILGSGAAGTVPAGTTYTQVCLRVPGANVSYTMTITPP
jgi:hypothetical protein